MISSHIIPYIIQHRKQIARFALVGILTFLLNYTLFWLFYGLIAFDYRFAVSLAYIFTIIIHFTLNRTFTYKVYGSSFIGHWGKYGVMLAINYLITLSVSIGTVEMCGLSPHFGVIFATVIIASFSFILMKHFVFLRKEDPK